ncbi:MAG: hypothetical protein H6Q75_1121 [Firmicutes bacterium]|nr:hypothetical protein [Bacillota bacterium]
MVRKWKTIGLMLIIVALIFAFWRGFPPFQFRTGQILKAQLLI